MLPSVLISTQEYKVLRRNGIPSSGHFRSSLFLKVKLEYCYVGYMSILFSLSEICLRKVVSSNSGILPLCAEFLCCPVRGYYLLVPSIVRVLAILLTELTVLAEWQVSLPQSRLDWGVAGALASAV